MYTVEEITNKLFVGDALEVLKMFPADSIDMCINSPAYFRQRTYNLGDKEIGREKSVSEYLVDLTDIFEEIYRVLKPTGTLWVNIGDKYKNGSLYGIPHLFVNEMMCDKWMLFNEIIWHKPNAFTGSSKKRFTQDFEYLFAFSKQNDYYFEQQYEPYKTTYKTFEYTGISRKNYKADGAQDPSDAKRSILRSMANGKGRHTRCVWSITHRGSKHTATFPRKLIEVPIHAACPPNGLVLDPFVGSGTTARIALEGGRNYVGIDLNPKSIEMALESVNCSC